MKKLRKFYATTILALAIALSASAGEMTGPGNISDPPPPTPQTAVTVGMSDPATSSQGDVAGAEVLDPVTSLALSLLDYLF